MLFNSYAFIFAFLPITWAGYYLLGRLGRPWPNAWLAAASMVFYGAWDVRFVPILTGSILFNFGIGYAISRALERGGPAKALLVLGIAGDVALLGYFKYANFFMQTANDMAGAGFHIEAIVLPLGISFFTFTQLAYLVDTYKGKAREYNFVDYALFVTYFPHLIAGPILHHAEMMPQFRRDNAYRLDGGLANAGLAIFVIGLYKKVGLADEMVRYAAPVFDAAAKGVHLTTAEAWAGTLAYTLQLYFDFSGYSDMAVGLSLLFGIRLPLNFAAPYQATNIIDFWRRWHMTLSRFLRDYLYIPLGGNRYGRARRYLNLMITMLLGGLWHGAGWTFVAWGALHGLYLVVNHAWRAVAPFTLPAWAARLITFLAVMVAWVYFRADTLHTANAIVTSMFGGGERAAKFFPHIDVNWRAGLQWMAGLTLVVWFGPAMIRMFRAYRPALDAAPWDEQPTRLAWQPNWRWTVWLGLLGAASILTLSRTSVFLYFQF